MAGNSSSGRHRLSDAEKKARGTWRANTSDAVYDARSAAKVVVGPWLSSVPDPTMPLNDVGKAKYLEFAKILLDGGKLTQVTKDDCERYAVLWQQMQAKMVAGRSVPMTLISKMDSLSVRLRVAENAPAIANPGARNKFASIGSASTVVSSFRLRGHSAA